MSDQFDKMSFLGFANLNIQLQNKNVRLKFGGKVWQI